MSGICGWFGGTSSLDQAPSVIERMASALPRHGRCAADQTSGPGFGLALRAHPAMASFTSASELAIAIEGYPSWSDPALAEIARAAGHAAAAAAAYRVRGSDLFAVLHGAFSFALFDLTARRALLAIDRFGVQTLCYARPRADVVVFGTTADAVRAHPDVGATVSVQSIFTFLYFVDRIPAPDTIYVEQKKLAPAEYLEISGGQCQVKRYWQMPYRRSDAFDKRALSKQLRDHLRAAVLGSLKGEEPHKVGAFLSGGLDSSSVVGIAASALPDRLKTFTIGFPVDSFDETNFAAIASSRFNTEHRVYQVQPDDLLNTLRKLIDAYDEPFANMSMVPAYFCARLAKETGVEVLLAGDGGDELFAGNERYGKHTIFDYYDRLPNWLRESISVVARRLLEGSTVGPLGSANRFIKMAERSVPERMMNNVFWVIDPCDMFSAEAMAEVDVRAVQNFITAVYEMPGTGEKLHRMMNFDLRVTLADSDLRKVNRMCELAGVRVHYPFLHEELAEFSAGLPAGMLMESGQLRSFYKEAMTDFLPPEILNKHKHGFGLPYDHFLHTHSALREFVGDGLTALKKRRYFRADFLDEVIGRLRDNRVLAQDGVLWDLLGLELWLQSREVRLAPKPSIRTENDAGIRLSAASG